MGLKKDGGWGETMRMLGGDIIRCIASLGEVIGWRVGGGDMWRRSR